MSKLLFFSPAISFLKSHKSKDIGEQIYFKIHLHFATEADE